jgi:hypothetical protein
MPKPSTAPADRNPNDHLSIWRTLLVQMIGRDVDTAHKGDRAWLRAVDDLFWGIGDIAWQKIQFIGEGEIDLDDLAKAIDEGRPAMVRLGKLMILYYSLYWGDKTVCIDHEGKIHPPTPWCFHCCRRSKGDIPLAAGLIALGAMTLPVEHFVVSPMVLESVLDAVGVAQ